MMLGMTSPGPLAQNGRVRVQEVYVNADRVNDLANEGSAEDFLPGVKAISVARQNAEWRGPQLPRERRPRHYPRHDTPTV